MIKNHSQTLYYLHCAAFQLSINQQRFKLKNEISVVYNSSAELSFLNYVLYLDFVILEDFENYKIQTFIKYNLDFEPKKLNSNVSAENKNYPMLSQVAIDPMLGLKIISGVNMAASVMYILFLILLFIYIYFKITNKKGSNGPTSPFYKFLEKYKKEALISCIGIAILQTTVNTQKPKLEQEVTIQLVKKTDESYKKTRNSGDAIHHHGREKTYRHRQTYDASIIETGKKPKEPLDFEKYPRSSLVLRVKHLKNAVKTSQQLKEVLTSIEKLGSHAEDPKFKSRLDRASSSFESFESCKKIVQNPSSMFFGTMTSLRYTGVESTSLEYSPDKYTVIHYRNFQPFHTMSQQDIVQFQKIFNILSEENLNNFKINFDSINIDNVDFENDVIEVLKKSCDLSRAMDLFEMKEYQSLESFNPYGTNPDFYLKALNLENSAPRVHKALTRMFETYPSIKNAFLSEEAISRQKGYYPRFFRRMQTTEKDWEKAKKGSSGLSNVKASDDKKGSSNLPIIKALGEKKFSKEEKIGNTSEFPIPFENNENETFGEYFRRFQNLKSAKTEDQVRTLYERSKEVKDRNGIDFFRQVTGIDSKTNHENPDISKPAKTTNSQKVEKDLGNLNSVKTVGLQELDENKNPDALKVVKTPDSRLIEEDEDENLDILRPVKNRTKKQLKNNGRYFRP